MKKPKIPHKYQSTQHGDLQQRFTVKASVNPDRNSPEVIPNKHNIRPEGIQGKRILVNPNKALP